MRLAGGRGEGGTQGTNASCDCESRKTALHWHGSEGGRAATAAGRGSTWATHLGSLRSISSCTLPTLSPAAPFENGRQQFTRQMRAAAQPHTQLRQPSLTHSCVRPYFHGAPTDLHRDCGTGQQNRRRGSRGGAEKCGGMTALVGGKPALVGGKTALGWRWVGGSPAGV